MYSTVPPPQQGTSGIECDGGKEKEGPPRGISEEKWQVSKLHANRPYHLIRPVIKLARQISALV